MTLTRYTRSLRRDRAPPTRHHQHPSRLSTAHSNPVGPGGDFTPTRISGRRRTDTRGIDRRTPASAKSLHSAAHWISIVPRKRNANNAVTCGRLDWHTAHRLPYRPAPDFTSSRRQLANGGQRRDVQNRLTINELMHICICKIIKVCVTKLWYACVYLCTTIWRAQKFHCI